MPAVDAITLESPVTVLHGVGPERQAQLARLGIRTVGELLLHRPRRHEDRQRFSPIGRLVLDEMVAVRGRVVTQGTKRFRRGTRSVFILILEDGTGRLHCRWWNLPFMERCFQTGQELVVYGKVRDLKPPTMDHPETEIIEDPDDPPGAADPSIHVNRLAPVYPATDGLPQRWLRTLIWHTLDRCAALLTDPWPDIAPPDLPSRPDAIRQLHFPDSTNAADLARQRLALDEFIELQLGIQGRRRRLQTAARAFPCAGDNRLIRPFLAGLPYRLTPAQTRVLRELRQDLAGPVPMRRLLQGDVGSGKTVVAACCALMALESGVDVAYMVPTEVLARQQWLTVRDWLEPLGVPVALLTGSQKQRVAGQETPPHVGSCKTPPDVGSCRTPAEAGACRPTLTVGTHALIEAGFAPPRLGLVIIDEQHKFGVVQRERLVRKGRYPHLLVMTATPIPRTLGLTLYGDLDVSVIDALPGERGRLRTHVRTEASLPKVWTFVRAQLDAGRQAYIVYPRVEEADPQAGLKAVLDQHEQLAQLLQPHRVGLLHGRLPATEKESVLDAFGRHDLDALVATSIIEVGLDVPNATVMVIENADRFGLSQLHQLRGRIGRGPDDAHCIVVAGARTREARHRLEVFAGTRDGFRIAEADLQLRGPGELLGQAQSGLPPLRFGNLATDLTLVERARQLAAVLLDTRATTSGAGAAGGVGPGEEKGPVDGDPSLTDPAPAVGKERFRGSEIDPERSAP